MRKTTLVILLHIGFWLCYSILVIIILAVYNRSIHNQVDQAPRIINAVKNIALFAIIPSAICYFSFYIFLFPRFLQQKKYLLSIAVGLSIAAITAIVFYIIHRYLIENDFVIDMDEGGKHGRSTAGRTILVMTFIGVICGIVGLVINGFTTWFSEMKLKELLKEKNHQMEMALIRSQLDPHLLFNTINNIDALILKDAVRASDYLNKLSDIMRFILYETKTDKIFLSRELEYISKYIDLQKIRTANEDYVTFHITGNVGDKQIVPMIFIPIIENAFKHTHNKKLKNAITIRVVVEEHSTHLYCENKFEHNFAPVNIDSGIGNELLQKRLKLIYAEEYKLKVVTANDCYCVALTIPNG